MEPKPGSGNRDETFRRPIVLVPTVSEGASVLGPEIRALLDFFLVNDAQLFQFENSDDVEHVDRRALKFTVTVAMFDQMPQILFALGT
jgi:hypothetical protein